MRFSPAINCIGAFLCAAAFLCALPNCRDLLANAAPAAACIALSAALVLSSVRLRRHAAYLVVLALFSLAIRLAWGLGASHPLSTDDDYGYYREVSLYCLNGNWSELLYTHYPWGYILYLYVLARIFGPSLSVPLIANAIVGSATVLLIYAIARRLAGESDARIAAGFYACWPGVIYWSSITCSEIPHALFFLAALLCFLVGTGAHPRSGAWLTGGGALAAVAEFIRPVSPLLLFPFVCYAVTLDPPSHEPSGPRKESRWKRAALAAGAYVVCLTLILTAKSIATGYPNFSASQTLGVNLAHGLNWETRGTYSAGDSKEWDWKDPRKTNRRGIQLARERLSALWNRGFWRLPALAIRKFPIVWSTEETAYDANYQGSEGSKPWMALYRNDFRAAGQYFHALVLALAAVGFWRNRRSAKLSLMSGILIGFALIHLVLEVDDRYHFPVQPILAIAAGAAFISRKHTAPAGPSAWKLPQ